MKKNLQNFKIVAVVLGAILITSLAQAATRTASVTGNWNNVATWGGASFPVAGDDVFINPGVTVTVNVASACSSVTFTAGTTGSTLAFGAGMTLTVSGAVTMNGTTVTSGTQPTLVTVGSGTLSCASLAINPNASNLGSTNRRSEVTISTGTVTVSGNISCSGDVVTNGGSSGINITSTGTLNIGGSFYTSPNFGLFTEGTGTVNYNAAGAQSILAHTYNNLTISGSGNKTLGTNTINGIFSIQGTAVPVGTTPTYSTATLEYKGSAAQTSSTVEFPAALTANVIIDNTAGVTMNAAKAITGNLTVTTGSNLTVGAFNFSVSATTDISGTITSNSTTGTKTFDNMIINTGGSFNSTANEDYSMTGNLQVDGTGNITSGTGTWTFSGNGTLSGTGSATITNADFTTSYSNTGTFTFANLDISAGPAITLTNNGTITVTTTLTGTDGFTQGAGDFLNFGGASIAITTFTPTGAGNTVNYDAAGAQTVRAGVVYQNLTLSGSGAKSLSAITSTTVNLVLSLQGTATVAVVSPVYNAATSTLEYAVSAAHTMGLEFPAANGPFNLRMNGAGGVTMNAARSIGGALTLTNGILTTTTTNLLTIIDNGTSSGGSTSSYISGPLRKNGNDAFTFRVGKAGVYSPIVITAPDNVGDAFRVEYRRESATALGPINASLAGLIYRVSNCEYWDVDEMADAGAATTISITAGWSSGSGCGAFPYISDFATIRLVHFDDITTNTWNTSGGTPTGNNTTGTVTRTGVNTFSPFALGSAADNANPLPVNLVNVKAFEKGSAIQIEWTNLTETELVGYFVERSANGRDYSTVGQVAPRANSGDRESYTSIDAAPLAGVSYYRIRATEVDGKSVYSKAIRVILGDNPKGLSLYPNPVRGNEVSIGFSAAKGQYNLRVMNTAGQEVYTQRLSHPGGTITQNITLPSSLKSGVYSLQISGDNFREAKMFVIQ
jgi:Secretion system C-terminal sorting domain